MKLLLAAGCSYTDRRFISTDSTAKTRGGWPMWPEIMGKAINLKTVNIGQSGISNQAIFNSIVDGINRYGDDIDTVSVLWTSFDRMQFFYSNVIPFAELHIHNMPNKSEDLKNWMDKRPHGDSIVRFMGNHHLDLERLIRHWIVESLRYMSLVIDLCNSRGYKLVMGQGPSALEPSPFNNFSDRKITSEMVMSQYMNNPYFKILEKNKSSIIGWPFMSQVGGWDFDLYRSSHSHTTVSDKDYHPNEHGQQIFADLFIKKWKSRWTYQK